MRRKSKVFAILTLMAGMSLSGCGQVNIGNGEVVQLEDYERVNLEAIPVSKGDLAPEFKFTVNACVSETVKYYPAKNDMVIKNFNHERGDVVEAGEVLLSFENEDLDDSINDYQSRLEEDYLLIDHYTRLLEMGSEECSEKDIEDIREDASICSAYLSELNAQKEQYNIVAKDRGVITDVSSMVMYGNVNKNDQLFTVIYGDGMFYADLPKDTKLKVGEIYKGSYTDVEYDLELVEINDIEDSTDDNIKRFMFQYKDNVGEIPMYVTLDITIKVDEVKNAIYVPYDAVHTIDEEKYVVVLGDDGYGYLQKIEVQTIIDDNVVVSGGLTGEERLVLK